ncbi:MAG TPA: NAD(+) diphosphatase [Micromonosporaceae bacterium]|nr:NAD(+) diphosphatase [Micromonosporaceae bacterium]
MTGTAAKPGSAASQPGGTAAMPGGAAGEAGAAVLGTARLVLAASAAAPPAPDDVCLAVTGRRVVVAVGVDGGWRFPRVAECPGATEPVPVGTLDGVPVWACVAASTVDNPLQARGWPSVAANVAEPLAALAGRALQVVTWRRTHRFCGACKAELADVAGEHARRCPACELFVPMQLSPAVLVLVRRGADEVLLVRHAYGPKELWALVAGFVESGESLEQAVSREVAEEVGLTVTGATYFGSQPWALSGPGVLLVGFTAVCADSAAEPVADGRELVEAAWFRVGDLPEPLPPAYSMSRWMIDAAADGRRSG